MLKSTLVADIDYYYGTNAKEIYMQGCRVFGWYENKKYQFDALHYLYSDNATREGFGVWFLAHSNWTNTNNDRWLNKISIEKKEIEESWAYIDSSYRSDTARRLVFAKNDNGYAFIGVYEPYKWEESVWTSPFCDGNGSIIKQQGEKKWVKTYRQVDTIYEKGDMPAQPMPFWMRREYRCLAIKFWKEYVINRKSTALNVFVEQAHTDVVLAEKNNDEIRMVAICCKRTLDEFMIKNTCPAKGNERFVISDRFKVIVLDLYYGDKNKIPIEEIVRRKKNHIVYSKK
ncbi:MAG: hypothetical protein ACI4MZ_01760 [Christensenellales bacterium]